MLHSLNYVVRQARLVHKLPLQQISQEIGSTERELREYEAGIHILDRPIMEKLVARVGLPLSVLEEYYQPQPIVVDKQTFCWNDNNYYSHNVFAAYYHIDSGHTRTCENFNCVNPYHLSPIITTLPDARKENIVRRTKHAFLTGNSTAKIAKETDVPESQIIQIIRTGAWQEQQEALIPKLLYKTYWQLCRWHSAKLEFPGTPSNSGSVEDECIKLLYHNYAVWHSEDYCRVGDPELTAKYKPIIDKNNQARCDAVEQLDCHFVTYQDENTSNINSETLGSIIDRIQITMLKILHSNDLSLYNRVDTLIRQVGMLTEAASMLWLGMLKGTSRIQLFKQLKMYNDPATNPMMMKRCEL